MFLSIRTFLNIALLVLLGVPARSASLSKVEHVVIFMQENRSFDHYFGTLRGVRGYGDRAAQLLANGNSTFYQPRGNNYVLPLHLSSQCVVDLDHGWSSGHSAWNNGKWDGWVPTKGT